MNTSRKQSGAVVVELALFLVPLLVLAFGITEFGRAMYQYNTLAKSVRDSARHLSQYAPGDSVRIDEAECLAVHGNLDCSGPTLVPGMSRGLVTVRDRETDGETEYNLQSTGRGVLNLVSVEVDGFEFQSVAPFFVPNVRFGPIQATMVQIL